MRFVLASPENMVITPQHTQMLMSALSAAVKVSGHRLQAEREQVELQALQAQLSHDKEMFQAKAGLVQSLVEALITRRIEVVRGGFTEVLALYAEQCRSYMGQQERMAEAQLKTTDPLGRADCRARLSEIDLQLTRIRADAAKLYREMTRVILLIGGAMPNMRKEDERALGLAPGA